MLAPENCYQNFFYTFFLRQPPLQHPSPNGLWAQTHFLGELPMHRCPKSLSPGREDRLVLTGLYTSVCRGVMTRNLLWKDPMSDRDAAFTSRRKDMWEGVSVDQDNRKVQWVYLVNMTGSRYSKTLSETMSCFISWHYCLLFYFHFSRNYPPHGDPWSQLGKATDRRNFFLNSSHKIPGPEFIT